MTDAIKWELTGIVGEDGHLERPLPAGSIWAPDSIELTEDRLTWATVKGYREVRPGIRLLTEFLALNDAKPDEILNYARRWGVLSICEHNLPSSHAADCRALGWHDGGRLWEPLAVWRRFARDGRALLNVASQLNAGKPGAAEDWGAIFVDQTTPGPAPWWQQSVEADALMLTQVLNEWLGLGNVRPYVGRSRRSGLIIHLGGGSSGLFGVLAVQLVMAAAASEGFAMCSACGGPYLPRRRPAAGRRRYCEKCREAGASIRDAARDYKRRSKAD
jgi:hypothetical protein